MFFMDFLPKSDIVVKAPRMELKQVSDPFFRKHVRPETTAATQTAQQAYEQRAVKGGEHLNNLNGFDLRLYPAHIREDISNDTKSFLAKK